MSESEGMDQGGRGGQATSKCRLPSSQRNDRTAADTRGLACGPGVALRRWVFVGLLSSALVLLASSGGASSQSVTITRHYCNFSNPTPDDQACFCPRPKCLCYYEDVREDSGLPFTTKCSFLTAVPLGINPITTTLLLATNNISTLDDGILEGSNLLFVEMFDIRHNLLTQIGALTLRPVHMAYDLLLGNNSIATISPFALRFFTVMHNADLSHNKLTQLPSTLFGDCRKLKTLDLSYNKLTSVQANLFVNNTLLKYLDLSNNRLSSLPDNIFATNTRLVTLTLRYNLLSQVPYRSLPLSAPRLNYWDLSSNHITNLSSSDFLRCPYLESLDLDNNSITTRAGGMWPTHRLHTLNLRQNHIMFLPYDFFFGLESLLTLDLSTNPFDDGIDGHALFPLGHLQTMFLENTNISFIDPDTFQRQANMTHLSIASNLKLPRLDYYWLWLKRNQVKDLDISYTNFIFLPEIGINCSLTSLQAIDTALVKLKWAAGFELCTLCSNLEVIDLSFSKSLALLDPLQKCKKLESLYLKKTDFTTASFDGVVTNHTSLQEITLSRNWRLTSITATMFGHMPKLAKLDLSYNTLLTEIHPDAFKGLPLLHSLSLSGTGITALPLTEVNKDLVFLSLNRTKSLVNFPEVTLMKNLLLAELTYAFHCCLFRLEAEEAPTSAPTQGAVTVLTAPAKLNQTSSGGREGHVHRFTPDELALYNELWNSGKAEMIPEGVSRPAGNFVCLPLPNPFTPCEDLFHELWLRIAAWIVSLLALGGNITVILVIVFGKAKLDNTRFLVLNLAVADLCLGVYLLILCVVDLVTKGVFATVALKWQFSTGAKVAGFLAVCSTEMSFYTLTLITLERYVTIHYSLSIRYRFTPRRLKFAAAGGWVFSFLLAVLPATGVLSDYTTYVLALPFNIEGTHDKVYVAFLLIFNGLSILIIFACYLKIYLDVRHSPAFGKNDNQIARRMALLVIMDLVCWLPLAVVALSATLAGDILVGLGPAKVLAVFVFPLNSCANPFLYAIVTNNFQRDLVKILKTFPEKVGDLSRRRSSLLKTTPQGSESRSALHMVAQFMAQTARKHLPPQDGNASYNNSASLPQQSLSNLSNSGRTANNGTAHHTPFASRLNAAQLDASSSSDGDTSLMSPVNGTCVAELCERRGTIVSFQASEITEITDCGAPSELGDQTPTPTSNDKRELECSSHRTLPAVANATPAILPDISEQSDPSSSSTSDHHGHRAAKTTKDICGAKEGTPPGPRLVTGGLLMGALSAIGPMLVGSSSSKAAQNAANGKAGQGKRNNSPHTRSTTLDKAETESMEKEEGTRARGTLASYRDIKMANGGSPSGSYLPRRDSLGATTDETPFCASLIETSL